MIRFPGSLCHDVLTVTDELVIVPRMRSTDNNFRLTFPQLRDAIGPEFSDYLRFFCRGQSREGVRLSRIEADTCQCAESSVHSGGFGIRASKAFEEEPSDHRVVVLWRSWGNQAKDVPQGARPTHTLTPPNRGRYHPPQRPHDRHPQTAVPPCWPPRRNPPCWNPVPSDQLSDLQADSSYRIGLDLKGMGDTELEKATKTP